MNMLSETDLKLISKSAEMSAIAAGRYIQSKFDQHYIKKHKEGGDSLASQVVTEVDLKAQEIIIEGLKSSIDTYDLGLLTEEATDNHTRHEKNYFWCIDPMDGTLPFTEQRTGYAVSIALISKQGDPYIGVVYIPDLDLCYSAIKGGGVFQNDLPFHRNLDQDNILHFYMDQSFQSENHYSWVKSKLQSWAAKNDLDLKLHSTFGGVRNAIGVMLSAHGCYFKFPKTRKGCGSIWDYAATRLFFEESGLVVSNMNGGKLHLNTPETTFMNDQGILYCSDVILADYIRSLGDQLPD